MCTKNLSSAGSYPSSLLRSSIPKKTRRMQKKKNTGIKESGGEMKLVNLKLYMENRSIMEENKRLREKAILLCEENRTLRNLLTSRSAAGTVGTKS